MTFSVQARDEAQTADIIAVRSGPAGTNQAYLDETVRAFRAAGVVDPYLDGVQMRTKGMKQRARAATM